MRFGEARDAQRLTASQGTGDDEHVTHLELAIGLSARAIYVDLAAQASALGFGPGLEDAGDIEPDVQAYPRKRLGLIGHGDSVWESHRSAQLAGRLNMSSFIVRWLTLAAGIWLAVTLVSGITVSSPVVLAVAALALALVNAVVRPVLVILTFPITLLTLGLFYFVVNGVAFGLAAALVPGFRVEGLGSAMLGALIVSVVSWVVGWFSAPPPAPRRA